jgi:hypothetical protein
VADESVVTLKTDVQEGDVLWTPDRWQNLFIRVGLGRTRLIDLDRLEMTRKVEMGWVGDSDPQNEKRGAP